MKYNLLEMSVIGTIMEHPFLLKESGVKQEHFETKANANNISVIEYLMNEVKKQLWRDQ